MTMTAAQVRERLHNHWPDDEYLKLEEVGQDAARQGRKIDMLVISTWASRGHKIEAVEIKVSMSDFRKEVHGYVDARGHKKGGPDKADYWWRHSHHFWIAMPLDLAKKAKDEVPPGWGLIGVPEEGKVTILVRPKRNESNEPFTWTTLVGMMRVAADCGANALGRAEARGRRLGEEAATARIKGGQRDPNDQYNLAQYDRLKEIVTAFESATGIQISGQWRNSDHARRTGEIVNAVLGWKNQPHDVPIQLGHIVTQLERHAKDLAKLRGEIAPLLGTRAKSDVDELLNLLAGVDPSGLEVIEGRVD